MNKKTIITILLTLVAFTGYAQTSKDSLYILGVVADGFTKAAIPDAFVTLMRTDSTVVDTMHVHKSQESRERFLILSAINDNIYR